MIREYKCIDCGNSFYLDTTFRCGAKRCTECKKIHLREALKQNRERYKKQAFDKRKQKNSFSFMTISEKEVKEDYQRFIRQEAMRANCKQEDIIRILCKDTFDVFIQYCKICRRNTQNGEINNIGL